MQDAKREILVQVREGKLTPEEAAARLEELERQEPASEAVSEAAPPAGALRVVRVLKQLGTAEIVGDPSVRDATADGPHAVRREGDVMTIVSEADDEISFSHSVHVHRLRVQPRLLVVRMNPALALEVSVQAGSLRVRDVRGPIKADVQAGSTRIEGFASPLELSVQAGSVRAEGRLDRGESHVRCELGSVRLGLDRGSSVRVSATSSLGKVTFNGGRELGRNEMLVGDGRGTLRVSASMGSVRVYAE